MSEVDPLALLSRITVDHPSAGEFHVDSEKKTVYVTPRVFGELAKMFGARTTAETAAFYAHGWVWKKW